jgi:hypothetical protein
VIVSRRGWLADFIEMTAMTPSVDDKVNMSIFCCHVNNIRGNIAHTPSGADTSAGHSVHRTGRSPHGDKRSRPCGRPRDGPEYPIVLDIELRDQRMSQ